MPVIIDEIVIAVEVDGRPPNGTARQSLAVEERQLIINECVERVFEILQIKAER